MIRKVAAAVNVVMGGVWLFGQITLWVWMDGIGGIHYSLKGFSYYSLFLVLLLAGPVLLIVGTYLSVSKYASVTAVIFNLVALFVMGCFLVPVIYEGVHPAPLVYHDYGLTTVLAVILLATCAATCCLCIGFVRDRRMMNRTAFDGVEE